LLQQLKWISLSQLANFVVPVALIPVLAHRLGVIGFASFAVLTGISQYATLGVELGLNYVALTEIKRCMSAVEEKRIFSEVFYVKILLALVVGCTLTAVVAASQLSKIVNGFAFAFLISGSLITCIIFPAWFFVLKNRLDINFKIAFGSRLALLLLCLLIVRSPKDYIRATFLFNFGLIPLACIYSKHWILNVGGPGTIRVAAMRKALLRGVQLSGAMLRETITNFGIAPLYGLFVFDAAIGTYAFAEKLSKVITMPAPLVTSAVIASTPNEESEIPIPRFVRRLPLWVVLLAVLLLYVSAALSFREVVILVAPQFKSSVPLAFALLSISPVVYFNYLEIGMRYTKQGRFREAGRLSYVYVVLLLVSSLLLGSRFGIWGLAVACVTTEIIQMCILLRCRGDNAAR